MHCWMLFSNLISENDNWLKKCVSKNHAYERIHTFMITNLIVDLMLIFDYEF